MANISGRPATWGRSQYRILSLLKRPAKTDRDLVLIVGHIPRSQSVAGHVPVGLETGLGGRVGGHGLDAGDMPVSFQGEIGARASAVDSVAGVLEHGAEEKLEGT